MAAPCKICSNGSMIRTVAEAVAAGASDQAISDSLGGGIGRMAISRHRRNHIMAPAKAVAAMAGKGMDVAAQRAQTIAAAEAGDPSAFLALAGIVGDLRRVQERLERTAGAAEHDNQRVAVASLSAQQLRAAEVRAKMGGIGGYAAQKAPGAPDGGAFNVTFNFSGGRRESVTLEASLVTDLDGADVLDIGQRSPELGRLVAAFGGGRN